jgi:tetratricopeptide (TPR) repeat protein
MAKAELPAALAEAHRLDRAGRFPEAAAAYLRFLQVQPGHADAWADYGGLLNLLERREEGRKACFRALRVDPSHPSAMINLGAIHMETGQPREAEGLFRRVLARDPRRNDARVALGECLLRQGQLDPARTTLEQAIVQDPLHEDAHTMLYRIWAQLGDGVRAKAELRRWHELRGTQDGPELQLELGYLGLLFGELPEAWDRYEARRRVADHSQPRVHPGCPVWTGEPFTGRTLLVEFEQGFGDTLMFGRFLALAKARGGRVLLSVQPALAELAATLAGVDQVIAFGEPLPPFDLQVSLVALPGIFRTRLDAIPSECPYLQVPQRIPNRAAIDAALLPSAGRIRIALAWKGNPTHKRDRERSLAPALLAPLAGLPEAAFFSFQPEPSAGPAPFPGVTALGPLLGSFADSAYALAAMDLVITVDTALAHLAGALGLPTFVLITAFPDWRWLLDRDDSPWYPSVRLYRQARSGDWRTPIQKLLADLTEA